jgi:hypothetical protein
VEGNNSKLIWRRNKKTPTSIIHFTNGCVLLLQVCKQIHFRRKVKLHTVDQMKIGSYSSKAPPQEDMFLTLTLSRPWLALTPLKLLHRKTSFSLWHIIQTQPIRVWIMCQSEKHVFLWRSFKGVRADQGLDNVSEWETCLPVEEDMFLTLTHYPDPDWLFLL